MDYEVNLMFPYILTFAISAICFGIAVWIANSTLYRPDSSDINKRKMWFWIMFVISIILPICINIGIGQGLQTPSATYDYVKHSCIADGVFAVLYILIGVLVSKSLSTKKVGSWFK